MPYTIRRGKGPRPWKIVNQQTGRVVGSSTSREKAGRSIAHRMGAERARS